MRSAADVATCVYHTGLDPFTKKPVQTTKNLNDSKSRWVLERLFEPENDFAVREALSGGPGRPDRGYEGQITANPPKVALEWGAVRPIE